MKVSTPVLVLLLAVVGLSSASVFFTKLRHNPDDNSCLILEQTTLRKFKGFKTNNVHEVKVKSRPAVKAPADSKLTITDNSQIVEIFAKNQMALDAHINTFCKTRENPPKASFPNQQQPEIEKIVDGGDQANRIDVVFMGDGYTAAERDQFFEDMRRLTTDMFEGVTFKSYLPVFNIWAIYVESVDSGIGYDGPKNTPFQLYRADGQLRGIYPGDPQNARDVCRLTGTSGCDYPSIIGNDDYYGGLGGEFVISTKSERTGTVVLRHEMGHNFIDVGEEYDNGQVYSGVNSASSLATVGWTHWLSEGSSAVEEVAIYRLLEYPWADLSQGEQSFSFNSDGQYSRWYLLVSVSAAGEEDSLEFLLDGEVLPWESTGFDDREFYDWSGEEGFASGQHTFTVRSKTNPTNPEIPRMICSITLHEYASETDFHQDNDYVSAYPTWDIWGRKVYRPTNEGCLMRNMTHNGFCPVCREGMWYQFFERITIIDSVEVASTPNPDDTYTVTLNTLQLGQLRDPENQIPGESLEVRWFNSGVEHEPFRDSFVVDATAGDWSVQVTFVTPEVRHDPDGLLQEEEAFTVG